MPIPCTLYDHNGHLSNKYTVKQMKPGACLAHTSRVRWAEEFALARLIKDGRVQGASLEVHKKKESYDVFLDWR